MKSFQDGTMNIWPEYRIAQGATVNVEVNFVAKDADPAIADKLRLTFKKDGKSYALPKAAGDPKPVVQWDDNHCSGLWVLKSENLPIASYELQAFVGEEAIDRPKRWYVEKSPVVDAAQLAGEFAKAFKTMGVQPAEARGPIRRDAQTEEGFTRVAMQPSISDGTPDLALWTLILKSTEDLSFNNFDRFMQSLCKAGDTSFPNTKAEFGRLKNLRRLPFADTDGYQGLKAAAEAFVIVNCGVDLGSFEFSQNLSAGELDKLVPRFSSIDFRGKDLDQFWDAYLEQTNGEREKTIPYLSILKQRLGTKCFCIEPATPPILLLAPGDVQEKEQFCAEVLSHKLTHSCFLELIWSYWHEESMLVQTIQAIARRFQNLRSGPGEKDPLAGLEISFLRPLNSLLWGYIQDEQHRLSLVRRAGEYDHEYGLRLKGKAIPANYAPADNRSRFLESFHSLLNTTARFFDQLNNTQIVADAFPVLNALREVHFILSEGAHNMYGDLPSTARIEMLMQQWLLAQPEFNQFLPTRASVAYPEAWMDRVAVMSQLQGWNTPSVMNFNSLAVYGEQILLSIRFGNWSDTGVTRASAANWAKFWREQIQGYLHAYRSVTGVDLSQPANSGKIDATLPSELLARQRARARA